MIKIGGRYIITGAQIGTIRAFLINVNALKVLKEIEDEQFIGNSTKHIKDDITLLQQVKLE